MWVRERDEKDREREFVRGEGFRERQINRHDKDASYES